MYENKLKLFKQFKERGIIHQLRRLENMGGKKGLPSILC